MSYVELGKHNTKDSLWMEINGIVYDVTKFIDEHPGGSTTLINKGGKIATEAFTEIGHSQSAIH